MFFRDDYGYREALQFYPMLQNYHAHMGYTSLLSPFISFH